jgi:hypothetical protein
MNTCYVLFVLQKEVRNDGMWLSNIVQTISIWKSLSPSLSPTQKQWSYSMMCVLALQEPKCYP